MKKNKFIFNIYSIEFKNINLISILMEIYLNS
jgi:hypothetical protein